MRKKPSDTITPSSELPLAQDKKRLSLEGIREISGYLLNGKRRSATELAALYGNGGWDFSELPTDEDEAWGEALESNESARERGYESLRWIWERPEREIAVVAHGGLFMLLLDGRHGGVELAGKDGKLSTRFGNCELRTVRLTVVPPSDDGAFGDAEGGGEEQSPSAVVMGGGGAGGDRERAAPQPRFRLELIEESPNIAHHR